MLEEGLVLGRDEGLDQHWREFVVRQLDAPLAGEGLYGVAVITANVGRQRRLIGKQLFRRRQPRRKIEPDGTEEDESLDAGVLRTGRAITGLERAAMSKDGSLRWYVSSKIPLRDSTTGAVMGVVCTSSDITERRELEQEILDISNREQRRLGSDMHDGLGQELTGLSLLLKGLEVQLSREVPQYLPQLTKISELLAHTIQSTRSLARGLAPVNLERGGLPEALRHLAVRCSDMYGLECTFADATQRLPELDECSATHLYRIAQEATTNAARYAHARHLTIQLRTTSRKLQLGVTDDGIGLSAGLAKGKPGMGLKIMEYRARMMGGTLAFEEPGAGTQVLFTCPLQLLRQARTRPQHNA